MFRSNIRPSESRSTTVPLRTCLDRAGDCFHIFTAAPYPSDACGLDDALYICGLPSPSAHSMYSSSAARSVVLPFLRPQMFRTSWNSR